MARCDPPSSARIGGEHSANRNAAARPCTSVETLSVITRIEMRVSVWPAQDAERFVGCSQRLGSLGLLSLPEWKGCLLRGVGKKFCERLHHGIGILLRHLSAGVDRETTNVLGPCLPDRQRVVEEHLEVAMA